jgi:hypothetical protein
LSGIAAPIVARKEGTVLKTFRYPRHLNAALQQEARAKGLSPNALVSMIFTKYTNWDRYAEKFGYVSITHETLRFLLSSVDMEKLATAAQESGAQVPKEAVMFWFKKMDTNTFLSYLENVCRYAGQAEYDCQSSGGEYVVTLRHEFGIKWSYWLKYSLDTALRKTLRIVAQFELAEGEVVCKFSTESKNPKQPDL